MGRRKKKTPQEEICDGFRQLAFGTVQDAVALLFADDCEILEKLPEYNLFNISEIKKPKGGGMEIKFFDRIKALEKLWEFSETGSSEPLSFYRALEEGAKNAAGTLSGDYGE